MANRSCQYSTPILKKKKVSKFFKTTFNKTRALKFRCQYKNIELDLTDSEIARLFNTRCIYCSDPAGEKLNGIDRVDNKKGYTRGNCVPCCSMCNYMKGKYRVEEFIKKCQQITVIMSGSTSLTNFDQLDNISCSVLNDTNSGLSNCCPSGL